MSRFVYRSTFAAMLAFITGCAASDTEPLGENQQALFANDKTAYDYFIGKGLTNFQAAGVVGNLDQESGVDPTIHQAGGGVGRGIAQWSTGARWDTTDKDNVLQYATQQGQSATSLGLQLDFMWYELMTFSQYGLTELKASTNLTDATTVIEDKFEGCVYANYPECALPSRINFAKGILNAYGANTGTGGQGGGGAGGGGAGGTGGASTGAGGSSGSGGTSISGSAGSTNTTVGGSAGSSGSAGTTSSTAAGASTGGNTSSSGGSSVAGSSTTAGSTTVAGNTPSGGNAATAGSTSFAAPSGASDDSSCAFSPPSGSTNDALASVLALFGLAFLQRRRTPRGE